MFEMSKTCPQDSAEVAWLDNHEGTSPTTSKNVPPRTGGGGGGIGMF